MGEDIRVFHDPWIPRPTTFKPITKPPAGLDNLLVFDLNANGTWDREAAMSYFWEVDREAIFSIPLGVRVRSDMMLWHYEDNSC